MNMNVTQEEYEISLQKYQIRKSELNGYQNCQ